MTIDGKILKAKKPWFWKVQEAPTGRYRSFFPRGWPELFLNKGDSPLLLAAIVAEEWDEYSATKVKEGTHRPLYVRLYSYERGPANRKSYLSKEPFPTLVEAKAWAENTLNKHPEFWKSLS